MATEVISAWDVYWVLQLDSIGTGFVVIPILGVVATCFVALVSDGVAVYDESKERFRAWPKLAFTVAGLMLLTSTFLPSSKTAAAMIVLPAVANNESVRTEAADLYKLAKQALSDAVGGDEKEAKE